jgi:hypothetical protein
MVRSVNIPHDPHLTGLSARAPEGFSGSTGALAWALINWFPRGIAGERTTPRRRRDIRKGSTMAIRDLLRIDDRKWKLSILTLLAFAALC